MFMLHGVDATGHYILIILNRKITGDIIISNYRHYNYGLSIFITYCPPVHGVRIGDHALWRNQLIRKNPSGVM